MKKQEIKRVKDVTSTKNRKKFNKRLLIKKKEHSRQCFRVDLKQDALDYLKECGSLKQTVLHFWKDLRGLAFESQQRNVQRWVKRSEAIRGARRGLGKIRPTGLTCVLPREVELYLANWIRSLRLEGIPVSTVSGIPVLLGLTVSTDLSTAMANEEVLQDEEEQTQSLEEGIEDGDEEYVSEDEEEQTQSLEEGIEDDDEENVSEDEEEDNA